MWAVIVRPHGASDARVSDHACLDDLLDLVTRDDQIVGVRLIPARGLTWCWNSPTWDEVVARASQPLRPRGDETP